VAAAPLLFDLDGTLCDSRPWYAQVFETLGAPRADVLRQLVHGATPLAVAQALGVSRGRFMDACAGAIAGLPLFPGVTTTLATLAERASPLGLVTNLAPRLVDLVLDSHHLRGFFQTVVPGRRGTPPKPHPASLRHALRDLGVVASPEIYYVGDTADDGQAARAAGISFAWVSYGYCAELPPSAVATLHRFSDVLAL
jgi:phosphoglycolate phosphatase